MGYVISKVDKTLGAAFQFCHTDTMDNAKQIVEALLKLPPNKKSTYLIEEEEMFLSYEGYEVTRKGKEVHYKLINEDDDDGYETV